MNKEQQRKERQRAIVLEDRDKKIAIEGEMVRRQVDNSKKDEGR